MKPNYHCTLCSNRLFINRQRYINHLEQHRFQVDVRGREVVDRMIAKVKAEMSECCYCKKELKKEYNRARHEKERCIKRPNANEQVAEPQPEPVKVAQVTSVKPKQTIPDKKDVTKPVKTVNCEIEDHEFAETGDHETGDHEIEEPEKEKNEEPEEAPAPAPEQTEEKQLTVFIDTLPDPEKVARDGLNPKFKVMYSPYGNAMPAVPAHPLTTFPEVNGIRILLEKDNLYDILNHKCGGFQEAYRLILAAICHGPEGDADIFEKVYLDGKSPDKYPMRILNEKENLFSYINKAGQEVTRGAFRYIRGCIRGNIVDCYLVVQQANITARITGKTSSYSQHDFADWQYKMESYYTNERRWKQMMKAVINRIKQKTKEYYGAV